MKRKLHEGLIAEIKDLFDGSYGSVRELSRIFNIPTRTMAYVVDYHGLKARIKNSYDKWRQDYRERYLAKGKAYYQKNKEYLREYARINHKKKYWADPEKHRAMSRAYYLKNKHEKV